MRGRQGERGGGGVVERQGEGDRENIGGCGWLERRSGKECVRERN